MDKAVAIIGGGLAGSEAALQLADRGHEVVLYEMRPARPTPVHRTGLLAELVCSNSLKSTKPDSAAGMLKHELDLLGSKLYRAALEARVPAGGALAVNRGQFAESVTRLVESHPLVEVRRCEARSLDEIAAQASAVVLATGPLTSDELSRYVEGLVGCESLAFFDAAAPIVMAESLDSGILFRQSRYESQADAGDYLNAPFTKEEYERFIDALLSAQRAVRREFETSDLFQACQPIEEIARSGRDAPRFGPMKPVGLEDPRTGRRPWAVLQLRAEDVNGESYNLVGFQTNLKFSEQERVFRMIPGLEHAEFARFGVMHRNTFIDAPRLLDSTGRLIGACRDVGVPVFVAGQLGGTEGYAEAIRSGLNVGISVAALLRGVEAPALPAETAFGALMRHATDSSVANYQPMHVNFGVMEPLDPPVRNKGQRYAAYARRGDEALHAYRDALRDCGLME